MSSTVDLGVVKATLVQLGHKAPRALSARQGPKAQRDPRVQEVLPEQLQAFLTCIPLVPFTCRTLRRHLPPGLVEVGSP